MSEQEMELSEQLPKCPFPHIDGLGLEPQLRHLLYDQPNSKMSLEYGEGGAWIVTRYEEVKRVATDRRFSRAALVGLDFERITPRPIAPPGSIFVQDPAVHRQMRSALAGAFGSRALDRMRGQIQRTVDELLEAMKADDGPADFMSAVADPLPTRVICQVLAIPSDDEAWLMDQVGALKRIDPSHRTTALEAQKTLHAYVVSLVDRRRRDPGTDLVSSLTAGAEEERLTDDEVVSLVISLILTGHDNVTNELGNIVFTLLTDGALRRQAETDFSAAFEELLRYIPFRRGVGTPRVALEDVTVGDKMIKSGDVVHVAYMAANRDPEKFPDPDELKPDRLKVPHMTFGWGAHRCPAEPLARLEIEIALTSLFARFPGLKLAVPQHEIEWQRENVNRLPLSLPVAW
ncbi:biflaviolin synthase CYP158A2 [Streptomyces fuscichromogenes]|uniref:Biflaviolin synthase CYP158A2 n=1 Tax=Streptomyces fuscichromogenes TaxID=1324013 RepID=A0A917XPK1_9ACTN|nr:biflaviolin synthase CYP158A2 [Streptomyces fuscichromogenes]